MNELQQLLNLQNVKEDKPQSVFQPFTMAGCSEKTLFFINFYDNRFPANDIRYSFFGNK
ncbi:MAG: hypothetical protein FWF50_05155 [Defluviitaleaceae bacterium]|nr:hypothetical protein [Defluviitaleaceae bacterium]